MNVLNSYCSTVSDGSTDGLEIPGVDNGGRSLMIPGNLEVKSYH